MKQRTGRVAEELKKELSNIIGRKLKDPRVGFVTVTDVDVTGDLSQATVYVTTLGDKDERRAMLEGLQKATGFMRSELGKVLKLRTTPELTFVYDETIEYGSNIERLLAEVQSEK